MSVMTMRSCSGFLIGLVLWPTIASPAPATTGITFQGQLRNVGVPVSDTLPMNFQLFGAPLGLASASALLSFPAVEVVNGLFTVELDFGAAALDGQERYLQVNVDGTPLTPRQRIAPTPYALHALNAGDGHSLDASDGSPSDALFVDATGQVGIGTTAPGAALDIVDATGLSLRVNDDLLIDGPTGFVGVGRGNQLTTAEVFGLRRTGTGFGGMYIETSDPAGMPFLGYATNGSIRGYHYVDSTGGWRLLLNGFDRMTLTSSGDLGLGITTPESKFHVSKGSAGAVTADVNSIAVFENSTNGYVSILTPNANERGLLFGEPSSAVAGGILYNSGGTPDGFQFRTNGNFTRMALDSQGRLGLGTAAPVTPFDLVMGTKEFQLRLDSGLVPGINLTGTGGNLGILRIRNKIELWPNDAGTTAASIDVRNAAGAVNIALDGGAGNASFVGAVSFGTTMRQMLNLWNADYGIGIQAFTQYFRSGGGYAWFNGGTHNDGTNNAGAGGNVLMVLSSAGNLGVGTTSPAAKLDVNGRARVDSLEIVGGADLAEAFEIRSDEATKRRSDEGSSKFDVQSSKNADDQSVERQRHDLSDDTVSVIEPGAVVVIDPAHPGALMVSTQAYDAKVAGIVSGAKGLAPGMVLRGEGDPHADGKHLVAMTGRVWCKCDASTGAIRAGDLLTTSATPGHAMRVATDAAVPRGAILGKAMSELTDGTGLVLVLVNLQ